MTLGPLHARLLTVTRSAFVAQEALNDLGPPSAGTGVVRTILRDDGAIQWEETGRWAAGDQEAAYWNRLRWEFDGAELRLHHLRRGEASPTHLVTLTCDDEGVLTPRAPHQCGADDYSATVTVTPAEITVTWQVSGPRKGYQLTTRYR